MVGCHHFFLCSGLLGLGFVALVTGSECFLVVGAFFVFSIVQQGCVSHKEKSKKDAEDGVRKMKER